MSKTIPLLQVALKCSDLGHLASSETVHRKWVQLLEEEMFRQVSASDLDPAGECIRSRSDR